MVRYQLEENLSLLPLFARALWANYRLVDALAFSPDCHRLVTGDAGHLVRLWDVDTGRLVLTLRGHEDFVTAIAFSPDGRWFVTASNDHTLRIWDAGAPPD